MSRADIGYVALASIWIADALDGDPDLEPDADGEDGDMDCCDAGDDTGTRYAATENDWRGCTRWGGRPGGEDDAEPDARPGYLRRCGRWMGAPAEPAP